MTSMECMLEIMEQPAERVKFRTEVRITFCETLFRKKIHRIVQTRFTGIDASNGNYFWVR